MDLYPLGINPVLTNIIIPQYDEKYLTFCNLIFGDINRHQRTGVEQGLD